VYRAQSEYDKAGPLYERALAIREHTLPPNHPDVGQSLNNLALLYKLKGNYGEAELLYRRALAVWEKTLGPNDPNVATLLENMAELYEQLGEIDKAAKLNSLAREIRQQSQW
jgi:tetratricopeptide (TPR) repeat protein